MEAPPTGPSRLRVGLSRLRPTSLRVAAISVVFGVLVGLLIFLGFAALSGPWIVAIGFVGGLAAVWREPDVQRAIGHGLYVVALMVLTVPVGRYLATAVDPSGVATVPVVYGLPATLYLWILGALLIAPVAAYMGRQFTRRSARLSDRN